MTTHRRALRLASGLVAAGLALTAAPYALAADTTAGTDGVIKLTDRQAQDLNARLSADAYPQEGPMTTCFERAPGRQVVDCWSNRVASLRTQDILIIRRDAVPQGT